MKIDNYNPYEDFESVFPRKLKRVYDDRQTQTDSWEEVSLNLCDICLDVRSQHTGASDPWEHDILIKTRDMISRRVYNWDYSKHDDIDRAVIQMCIAALGWIEKSLEERKDWNGYNNTKQEQA